MTATSTDGGRTFGPAVDLAEPEAQGGYDPRIAVQAMSTRPFGAMVTPGL